MVCRERGSMGRGASACRAETTGSGAYRCAHTAGGIGVLDSDGEGCYNLSRNYNRNAFTKTRR